MRKSFVGFYQPTENEYKSLWDTGLIVFDTNVLLDLYRLPEVARNEVFSVFDQVKERIWIPHQVALEFQRRRFTVISSERKITSDALKSAQALLSTLEEQVAKLEIDKRGLDIDSKPLIADLKSAHEKMSAAINKVHDSQVDIKPQDSIRERLDGLFENKVGKGFGKQEELDFLVKDGEERYQNKIPPGFEDAVKDKNPSEAFFYFDGIKYPRKFGDLILWKQIINHVKLENIQHVIFVTGDRKEDWWWKEQGKTIGPRSELVREISAQAEVKAFWMYELSNFLEQAKKYTSATISSNTITEIDNVALIKDDLYTSSESLKLESFKTSKSPSLFLKKYYKNINEAKRLTKDLFVIRDYLMSEKNVTLAFDNGLDTIGIIEDDKVEYYFLININLFLVSSNKDSHEIILSVIESSSYDPRCHVGKLIMFDRPNINNSISSYLYDFATDALDYSLPIDEIVIGSILNNKFKELRTFKNYKDK